MGFTDETFLALYWFSKEQQNLWSGYKKKHGIKYQGILTPSGLVLSMAGPYLGKINDHCMVSITLLQDYLYKVLSFVSFTYFY